MSRLVYSALFAFSLSVLSFSAVGCGGSGNEVIEDTRSEAEINQEMEDYEKQMEEADQITQ
ncbi:hypothetical protein Enr13x_73230 [Stieleria neptunia]|uniref:Secreted protein n=1 Tax=Stieleria neptunia TaxID=2527979 RepID=A0A518I2Z7_9BACT|nr:hypothetical protein [Stieleria neptunia]QDV47414.1 hypothetical protein Enr13x_73230 [Stieleria neptunia]